MTFLSKLHTYSRPTNGLAWVREAERLLAEAYERPESCTECDGTGNATFHPDDMCPNCFQTRPVDTAGREDAPIIPLETMSLPIERALALMRDGGFRGARGRVLWSASDESGLHTIRVVEYEFVDSVVPYVEVEEAAGHSDAPARIYAFSAAVHALQNLGEDEVWTIGNRLPRADEPIGRAATDTGDRIIYAVDWGNGADETAVSAIRCNSDGTAMVLAVETGEKAYAVVAFLKACGIGVVEDATAGGPSETEPPAKDSLTAEAGAKPDVLEMLDEYVERDGAVLFPYDAIGDLRAERAQHAEEIARLKASHKRDMLAVQCARDDLTARAEKAEARVRELELLTHKVYSRRKLEEERNSLQSEVTRLTAALKEAVDWRPIETAPREFISCLRGRVVICVESQSVDHRGREFWAHGLGFSHETPHSEKVFASELDGWHPMPLPAALESKS